MCYVVYVCASAYAMSVQAATKFFTLLFLAKTHAVRLAQPELFGDIEISPVARTGAPSESPSLASSRVGSPLPPSLPDGNSFASFSYSAHPPSVPSTPTRTGAGGGLGLPSRPPSVSPAREPLVPPVSPPNTSAAAAVYTPHSSAAADYSLMQQRLSQDARIQVQQSL